MKALKIISLIAAILIVAGATYSLIRNNNAKKAPVYEEGYEESYCPDCEWDYLEHEEVKNITDTKSSSVLLLVKVVFSLIFCLAALYVILSRKKEDETRKWAFSILTLIAGVWIGTVL